MIIGVVTLVNLTIAHLRIALLGGNPEVGNSEYMDHQNYKHIFQTVCVFEAASG